VQRRGVLESWTRETGVGCSFGVVNTHSRSLGPQPLGDVERGGVAYVVGSSLEGCPEHRDRGLVDRAVDERQAQAHRPRPLPQVHAVDLAEQSRGVGETELLGPGHERPRVLRQAASPVADTGSQERRSDSGVEAEHGHQVPDVGIDDLADLRQEVHQGQARCEHGVGRHLRQLRCRQVCPDDGHTGRHEWFVHLAQGLVRLVTVNTEDQAVRTQ
jgi:hypothetical protein